LCEDGDVGENENVDRNAFSRGSEWGLESGSSALPAKPQQLLPPLSPSWYLRLFGLRELATRISLHVDLRGLCLIVETAMRRGHFWLKEERHYRESPTLARAAA
jgi:hypothetical protein